MHTVVTNSCKVKFRSDSLSTIYTRVSVREIYLRFTLLLIYIYMIFLQKYHFTLLLFVENTYILQFKSPILVYINDV